MEVNKSVFSLMWGAYDGAMTTMYFLSFNKNLFIFDVDKKSGHVKVTAFDGRYRIFPNLSVALKSISGVKCSAYYTLKDTGRIPTLVPLPETGATFADVLYRGNKDSNKVKVHKVGASGSAMGESVNINDIIASFKTWFVGVSEDEAYFLRVVNNKVECYKETKSKALENRAGKYYNIVGQGNEIVLRNKEMRRTNKDELPIYPPIFYPNIVAEVEKVLGVVAPPPDSTPPKPVVKLVKASNFKLPAYRSEFLKQFEQGKFTDCNHKNKYIYLKYYGQFGKYAGVVAHMDTLLANLINPVVSITGKATEKVLRKRAAVKLNAMFTGVADPFRVQNSIPDRDALLKYEKISKKYRLFNLFYDTLRAEYLKCLTDNGRFSKSLSIVMEMYRRMRNDIFKYIDNGDKFSGKTFNFILHGLSVSLNEVEYEIFLKLVDYTKLFEANGITKENGYKLNWQDYCDRDSEVYVCLKAYLLGYDLNGVTFESPYMNKYKEYYNRVFKNKLSKLHLVRGGIEYTVQEYENKYGSDLSNTKFYSDLADTKHFNDLCIRWIPNAQRVVCNRNHFYGFWRYNTYAQWKDYFEIKPDALNELPEYLSKVGAVHVRSSRGAYTVGINDEMLNYLYQYIWYDETGISKARDNAYRFIEGVIITCAKRLGYNSSQIKLLANDIAVLKKESPKHSANVYKYLLSVAIYLRCATYDSMCEDVRTDICKDMDRQYTMTIHRVLNVPASAKPEVKQLPCNVDALNTFIKNIL